MWVETEELKSNKEKKGPDGDSGGWVGGSRVER